MKQVMLFSQKNCPYCTELKDLMDSNAIPYTVKDIEEHEKEWEAVSKHSEVDYVPTVLIVNKDEKLGSVLAPDRDFDEPTECLQLILTHLTE